MTGSVRYRESAIADIEAIYDYIADDSGPVRALAFTDRLRAHCEKLALFPLRGRRSDDLSPGLRLLAFERVTIAYRVDDAGARIVRVFYAGWDYSREDFPD